LNYNASPNGLLVLTSILQRPCSTAPHFGVACSRAISGLTGQLTVFKPPLPSHNFRLQLNYNASPNDLLPCHSSCPRDFRCPNSDHLHPKEFSLRNDTLLSFCRPSPCGSRCKRYCSCTIFCYPENHLYCPSMGLTNQTDFPALF
jgi:hypothetical protein